MSVGPNNSEAVTVAIKSKDEPIKVPSIIASAKIFCVNFVLGDTNLLPDAVKNHKVVGTTPAVVVIASFKVVSMSPPPLVTAEITI